MTFASKSFPLDEDGRLQVDQSGSKIKHAKISVGAGEVELSAGLAHRRRLYIKPVRSGTDDNRPRRWIVIGPPGMHPTAADGTPIWEEYELVLNIGPDDEVFATKGDAETGEIDVRIIELGEN